MIDLWGLFVEPVLAYGFMRDGLMAAAVVGTTSAVLSCLLVVRGQALLGDAISHSVLLGVVVGYLVGGELGIVIGALAVAMLTGVGITYITRNAPFRADTSMGIVFTVIGFGFKVRTSAPAASVVAGAETGEKGWQRLSRSVHPSRPLETIVRAVNALPMLLARGCGVFAVKASRCDYPTTTSTPKRRVDTRRPTDTSGAQAKPLPSPTRPRAACWRTPHPGAAPRPRSPRAHAAACGGRRG